MKNLNLNQKLDKGSTTKEWPTSQTILESYTVKKTYFNLGLVEYCLIDILHSFSIAMFVIGFSEHGMFQYSGLVVFLSTAVLIYDKVAHLLNERDVKNDK